MPGSPAETLTGEVAAVIWSGLAADLIVRHGLDLPPAAVTCWNVKHHCWMALPITANRALKLLFPTPAYPSYPSGHATVTGAAAVTLAALFPEEEADLPGMAAEATTSRCWGGHFSIDDDIGLATGHTVGYLVAEYARTDCAD